MEKIKTRDQIIKLRKAFEKQYSKLSKNYNKLFSQLREATNDTVLMLKAMEEILNYSQESGSEVKHLKTSG